MNALATIQPAQAAPVHSMSEMERMALAIAKGRLFGSDDPNAVLTLCLVAQAEGKHPGLVLQQYHIIQGKPAKKAEAMQVDFLASGGKIEWHQLDDTMADATFSHPAGGSVRIAWDMKRAQAAGLGGKDMWKKFPRQMLRSRCISEGVRTVFPGATSGLYVPEEIMDFDDKPARTTPAAPKAQRARDMDQGQLPPPEPKITPEQWTERTIAAIEAAADTDALAEIVAGATKAANRLSETNEDLFERLVAAQRAAEQRLTDPAGNGDD